MQARNLTDISSLPARSKPDQAKEHAFDVRRGIDGRVRDKYRLNLRWPT